MNYLQLFRVTLPETILEVAALLVLVMDLGLLRKSAQKVRLGAAVIVGVAGCLSAIVGVQMEGPQWLTFDGSGATALLATGGFTAVAQYGILVLTALTLFLLFDSVFTNHVGEFVAVLLMAASGGLLIAAAQDLLVIFIGLELLSLGLYILTAFSKSSSKSAESAIKYYLFGGMSAAFLLFGFSYFYGLTGTTSLALIQSRIAMAGPSPLLYVAWVLVVAGLGFKIAVVPFHLWAPDAYEGAPAPAAAFIASVSKVASFALLVTLAVNWWVRPSASLASAGLAQAQLVAGSRTWPALAMILLVVSAASMVWGNLAALAQTSVRRLLAYSAIAHAGYMLLALAVRPVPGNQRQRGGVKCGSRFSRVARIAERALLRAHLRSHDHRRLWVGVGSRASHRERPDGGIPWPAKTESRAGRNPAGVVPFAGGHSATGGFLGQVQPVCGGTERARGKRTVCTGLPRDRDERGVALLLSAGVEAGLRDAGRR